VALGCVIIRLPFQTRFPSRAQIKLSILHFLMSFLLKENPHCQSAVDFIKEQTHQQDEITTEGPDFSFCKPLKVDILTLQILYASGVSKLLTERVTTGLMPAGLDFRDLCLIVLASYQYTFNRDTVRWPCIDCGVFKQIWEELVNARDYNQNSFLTRCVNDRNKAGLLVAHKVMSALAKEDIRKAQAARNKGISS
jgi:hypothetical protein